MYINLANMSDIESDCSGFLERGIPVEPAACRAQFRSAHLENRADCHMLGGRVAARMEALPKWAEVLWR